jgi:hypothetical protein
VKHTANLSDIQLSVTVLTNRSLPYINLSMKRLELNGESYKSKYIAQVKFSFTSSSTKNSEQSTDENKKNEVTPRSINME